MTAYQYTEVATGRSYSIESADLATAKRKAARRTYTPGADLVLMDAAGSVLAVKTQGVWRLAAAASAPAPILT